MINELIYIYEKQFKLYSDIKDILENVQKQDFDIISYNLEFENAEYILNQIEKLNTQAEQLKLLYISKNNLNDFTGEDIKKLETEENYLKIKTSVDNITKIIASVKKTQDAVINKINAESNINKKAVNNLEKQNAIGIYKNNVEKK